MRTILISFALFSMIAGCGQLDMVVEAGPAPDAGVPFGDGGPMMGDGGMPLVDTGVATADTGIVGDDANVDTGDAGVDPADAWVAPTSTCGNGVLDPGEVCDPGHIVHDDGGVHVVVSPSDLAFCPDSDCARVACPSSVGMYGGPVDNRYCVYYIAPTTAVPAEAHDLVWTTQAERDSQFAVLRAAMAAQGSSSWTGSMGLHRVGTCIAPGSNTCPAGATVGSACRPTSTTTGVCEAYGGFGSPSPATRCEPLSCTWHFFSGDAPVALPPWSTTRFLQPSPEDCTDMMLNSGTAMLGQTICGGTSSSGSFVTLNPPNS